MTKIFYKIGFHESNDEASEPNFLEFIWETGLTFPPPIGTEVFFQLEHTEVDPKGDHGEFFKVCGYKQKLRGTGDDPFEESEFVVILSSRPGPHDDHNNYFGKVDNPDGFSKLLEHFGWTRAD